MEIGMSNVRNVYAEGSLKAVPRELIEMDPNEIG
jgi:hypothetical protein